VSLRNPRETAQDFELDLRAALELPQGATSSFHAQSPYGDGAVRELAAKTTTRIHLEPFQVLVWDLTPQ